MQKKLLLSLLATVPTALPALADIALTAPEVTGWNTTGIVTDGLEVNGNTVTCKVGVGTVSQVFNKANKNQLPAGNYKLTFSELKNAKVSLAGATLTPVKDSKTEFTFTVTTQTEITINIDAVDADAVFVFADGMLTFVEDFTKKAAGYQAELDKIVITVISEGAAKNDKAAKTLYDGLVKNQKTLQTVITSLSQADKTSANAITVGKLVEIYSKAVTINGKNFTGFEALFTALQNDLNSFAASVTTGNETIKAANTAYDNSVANDNAKKSYENSLNYLLNTDIANCLKQLEGITSTDKDVVALKNADIAAVNAFKKEVEAWGEQMKAAFNVEYGVLVDTKAIEDALNVLREKRDELNAKVANDVVAVEIYKQVNALYTDGSFDKAYLEANAAITAIIDAKEYTGSDVYAAAKTGWLNKIQAAYDEWKKPASIADIKAALGVQGYKDCIAAAKAEMAKVVADAEALAEEQNAAYLDGYKLYATPKTGWDAQLAVYQNADIAQLPAAVKTQYNKLVAAAEKAINAFKAYLDTTYAANTLPGADYNAKVADVDNAFQALDNFLGSDAGQVAGLITKLAEIKAASEPELKKLDLSGKFDATYASFQDAIDALIAGMTEENNYTPDAAKLKETQDGLDNFETAAANYIDAFTTAFDVKAAADKNLKAFKTTITSKYKAENGATWATKDVKSYGDDEKEFNKLVNAYKAAAALEGQAALNDALKLAADYKDLATTIANHEKAWLVTATAANLKAANDRLTKLQNFVAEHGAPATDPKLGDVKTALEKVSVPAEGSKIEEFDKADKAIKAQIDAMAALYANVSNYEAVMDEVKKVAPAATAAEKANNDITIGAAAKAYYQKLIDGYKETKTITDALDAAYKAKDGVTADITTKLKGEATAKVTALKGIKDAIPVNQKAYSDQVAKSGDVRTAVQAILDNVKKAEYQGVVADWVKQLEDLLNKDLIANDGKVGEAYAEGKSKEVNDAVMAEYQRILDAANDVAKQYEDGYDAGIIDANNALNGEFSDWGAVNKDLNDEYLKAVKLYTFYQYSLTEDAGYAEWMLSDRYGLIANYAKVYDFLPVIQDLNSQIQVLITKANEAKQFLPESKLYKEQYDALVAEQAKQLAELTAMYNALGADADKAAGEYYDAKVAEFNTELADQTAYLTGTGMEMSTKDADKILKPVTDVLADCADILKTTKLTKGEAMNSVATKFAGINVAKTVETGLLAYWDATYTLLTEGRVGKPATGDKPAVIAFPGVAELRDTMVKSGASDEDLENFDAIVKKMAELNITATTVAKDEKVAPIYKDLKAQVEELTGYRNDLQQLTNKALENEQYRDLWNGYMDEANELQAQIDELKKYIAEFTLTESVSVSDAEDALETLKNIIGENPSAALADATKKAAIETQKGIVEKAIEDTFVETNKAAVATLNTWLDKTKEAYNTARAEGKTEAELKAEYDAIQTIQAEIAGITFDQGFAGDFYTVANGYIDQLLEVYKKLNPTGSADDLAAIKAALEEEKADIAQEIEDAKAAIAETVKAQLGEDDPDLAVLTEGVQNELFPEYDALLSQLEAIQAAWEAEGDRLLVNSETYESRMDDEVQDAIEPINEKVLPTLADIEKSYDNNVAYHKLNTELQGLFEFALQVRTEIQNYGLEDQCLRPLTVIEAYLVQLEEELGVAAGKVSLTPASTLASLATPQMRIDIQTIFDWTAPDAKSKIEALAADANLTYAEHLQFDAEQAYNNAYEALVGKYLVNGAELKAQYRSLESLYSKAVYGYWESDNKYVYGLDSFNGIYAYYYFIGDYKAIIEKFQTVIDGSAKLLEDAKDQEYTPGDVVNRDGKVTSQDVMQLVDWVGNGITYAELADNAETAWQAAAADINGDKNLNIADINLDIQLALGNDYVNVSDRNLFRSAAAHVGEASFSLAYLGNVEGADRYAVVLNNPVSFIGGQFDIKLPVGLELVQVLATERTEAHDVMTFEHNAYESRVLIFSMENAVIGGSNGAVAYIDVRGNGSFSLDNVLFTDSNCELYGFDNPGTSGIIDAIIDGAGAAKEAIYDAAGRMYDRVQRGVNIIRHSDGSVTKELRK